VDPFLKFSDALSVWFFLCFLRVPPIKVATGRWQKILQLLWHRSEPDVVLLGAAIGSLDRWEVRLDDKGVPLLNGHGSKMVKTYEFAIVYRILLNNYPFTSYFRLGIARVPGL
jgi:hypothetical protein